MMCRPNSTFLMDLFLIVSSYTALVLVERGNECRPLLDRKKETHRRRALQLDLVPILPVVKGCGRRGQ